MCAMTGLNILPLTLWCEGVRRTGEGFVGCQSNVPHEIDCHPELVSGSHQILKHRGKSDAQKMLKQVQHDGNSLKRTYSLINLFSYSPHKKAAFTLAEGATHVVHFNDIRRVAFTLAEVLITLGIIGVVAAMTMPSLINNYQKKQTVTQLKKVYSELSQAAEMAKFEYGDPSLWDYSISSSDFFKKYLSSYMEISNTTVGTARQHGIKYYGTSGAEEKGLIHLYDNAEIITLPSGTQIFAYSIIPSTSALSIKRKSFTIDLNGFKRPNKFGRDLFSLSVTEKGVRPMSYDDNESSAVVRTRDEFRDGPSANNYQCNKQGRGMWCAALIMADGWEIRSDYPW